MASLRYHAGRMVLYEEEPSVWRVKIKTKKIHNQLFTEMVKVHQQVLLFFIIKVLALYILDIIKSCISHIWSAKDKSESTRYIMD